MERYFARLQKRQKTESDASTSATNGLAAQQFTTDGIYPPSTIVSWNANSIKLRAERQECAAMIKYLHTIEGDALFLQETRLKPEDQSTCEAKLKQAGLSDWRFYWNSHPLKRYSGTACIVRRDKAPLRVTVSLKPHLPSSIPYPPGGENPDQQGRVIVLEYQSCYIVNLYVPMCSWYADGRALRDVWDQRLIAAVRAMQQIKPVILVGDFNVCHTPLDVSHPSFFEAARKPRNVGDSGPPSLPGQPGYTQQERDRFGRMLSECELVDTFRALHPAQQRLTWGYAANFEVGVYRGKYMGLDYVLVPQRMWEERRVVRSEVGGRERAFGSDHCLVFCQLDWGEVAKGEGETGQDKGRTQDRSGSERIEQQQQSVQEGAEPDNGGTNRNEVTVTGRQQQNQTQDQKQDEERQSSIFRDVWDEEECATP